MMIVPLPHLFTHPYTACVVGASRGIGLALVRALLDDANCQRVYAACRRPITAPALQGLATASSPRLQVLTADVTDESTLRAAFETLSPKGHQPLHLLLHTVGVLQDGDLGLRPERRLEDLDPDALLNSLRVNAIGPLLLARHAFSALNHAQNAVFASLSARVGSIGDNRLGGWYAYRGAKAAQNQYLRTLAVECKRRAPRLCVLALHPGTVDTDLSRPFQGSSRSPERFSPEQAAAHLLRVISARTPADSGGFDAWDGSQIPW